MNISHNEPSEQPEHPRPVHPFEQPLPPSLPAVPVMPPVRRVEIPQSTPVLCYVILGVNVLVFVFDWLMGGALTRLGAKDNLAILQGQYWRLITPMFLHGGWIHLGFNSYFLYVIGPQVERPFGHLRFVAIYVLSGMAGVIASFALSPYRSIGASGALFGLIGALVPLLYRNRKVLANTVRGLRNILLVIAVNLIIGLTPGIDNWAHLGGLLTGLAVSWFTAPRYTVRYDLDGIVRIEDQTSPLVAWAVIVLAGLGLLVLLGVLMMARAYGRL
jgi:rhomboid protease GluP